MRQPTCRTKSPCTPLFRYCTRPCGNAVAACRFAAREKSVNNARTWRPEWLRHNAPHSFWGVPMSSTASANERSEEHTSELQSRENLVCQLFLEKKKTIADM